MPVTFLMNVSLCCWRNDYEAAIPTTFEHQETCNEYDISTLMKNKKVHDFTEQEKYMILKNHFVSDEKFDFPKKELHGCNR